MNEAVYTDSNTESRDYFIEAYYWVMSSITNGIALHFALCHTQLSLANNETEMKGLLQGKVKVQHARPVDDYWRLLSSIFTECRNLLPLYKTLSNLQNEHSAMKGFT